MEEDKYGTHKKSGFVPKNYISYGPLFAWPMQPLRLLKWLPSYFLPWNVLFVIMGVAYWYYLMPPLEEMKTFQLGWISYLLGVNMAAVILWYGAWHGWLYILKRQGTRYKYNARWPSNNNEVFLFKRQNVDNVIWSLCSGVPIFTAWMVLSFWLFANGYIPYLDPIENPGWFAVILLLTPLFGEVHFYVVHRILHFPTLYKYIHSLHHNNVNPGPWSGLSMHPVEHVFYFCGIVMIALCNAHPIHMISYAIRVSLGPAIGHVGFDKVEVGKEAKLNSEYYAHYLHHKLFEVNYADGVVPLDKWFGSFHDGSPEAEELLRARMRKRKEALAAKSA